MHAVLGFLCAHGLSPLRLPCNFLPSSPLPLSGRFLCLLGWKNSFPTCALAAWRRFGIMTRTDVTFLELVPFFSVTNGFFSAFIPLRYLPRTPPRAFSPGVCPSLHISRHLNSAYYSFFVVGGALDVSCRFCRRPLDIGFALPVERDMTLHSVFARRATRRLYVNTLTTLSLVL